MFLLNSLLLYPSAFIPLCDLDVVITDELTDKLTANELIKLFDLQEEFYIKKKNWPVSG